MNVLLISLEFPPEPGGIGEYAYQTANGLTKIGHRVVTVVNYQQINHAEFLTFKNKQNFEIYRLKKYYGRTKDLIKSFWFFRKIFLKHKSELIIVVSSTTALIAWMLKKLYKIPYFIVGHGSEFLESNYVHEKLMYFCFSKSNLILANSSYTFELALQFGISIDKMVILHPGADDDLFDYSKYPKPRSKKNIILSVGSLSVRKGHRFVIEAISILKNKIPDIEYWIIGKGVEKENLQNQIKKLGLLNCVKLFGFVDRSALPGYYSQADIFILNSTNIDRTQVEGFGIVLIEAHLMKLAVIGAKNSGMEDAILDGQNGVLIDTKSINEIVANIEDLIIDKRKRTDYGKNGYLRAKQEYTWKVFSKKLDTFIKQYVLN